MNVLIPRPSTPRVVAAPPSSPAPASPGTWRHPKYAEIVSRRNASIFTEQDFRRVAFNSIALLISFTLSTHLQAFLRFVETIVPYLSADTPSTINTNYVLLALRLYLLTNVALSLFPLIRSRADDTITDIPLTASQRSLMGLPPSPSPSKPTPSITATSLKADGSPAPSVASSPIYITPPRYKRSSFSPSPSPVGSGSHTNNFNPSTPSGRSISATYGSSPHSGRSVANLSPFRSISSSSNNNRLPRSPSGSPLLQKAITNTNRERDDPFRSSFSPSTPAGSGLRRSQSVKEGKVAGSSGSGSGGRRSPALNYKWLYEKEMRGLGLGRSVGSGTAGLLSRSESMQS